MDETNWSNDFYSDIFSLGFDSLLNKSIMRLGFHITDNFIQSCNRS